MFSLLQTDLILYCILCMYHTREMNDTASVTSTFIKFNNMLSHIRIFKAAAAAAQLNYQQISIRSKYPSIFQLKLHTQNTASISIKQIHKQTKKKNKEIPEYHTNSFRFYSFIFSKTVVD